MEEDNFGLEVVFPPDGVSAEKQPVIDLVFVHGLGGDRLKTWTNPDNKKIWISDSDFLRSLADKARVMTFGYNANVYSNVTTNRVVDHATDLLEELVVKRQSCMGRPLIFIAHSLGGLVVKRALLLGPHETRYTDISKMTCGIIFLGTPHQGSPHPVSLEVTQKLYAWATWSPAIATNITKELETYSNTTVDINRSFMGTTSQAIEIVCFYETRPTRLPSLKGAELIVPQQSASIYGNNARNISMACTHTQLSKFANPEEARFRRLWDQLNIVVTNALQRAGKMDNVERNKEMEDERLQNRFAQLNSLNIPRGDPTSVIEPFPIQESRNILENKNYDPKRLQNRVQDKEDPHEDQKRQQFLSSLGGWTEANRGYGSQDLYGPLPGTCQWIFDNETFKAWIDNTESSLIFITGGAGCGKSFLAKFLAEHLHTRAGEESIVLPFFCNNTKVVKNEAPILHFFIHELISQKPALFKHASSRFRDRYQQSPKLLTSSLMGILKNIANDENSGKIIFLIDGLDECDTAYAHDLLTAIDWMFKEANTETVRSPNNIRIIIMCREEKGLENWCPDHLHISITPAMVVPDISIYVDYEMQRMTQAVKFSDINLELVAEIIKESAEGIFLWVRHVIKDLEQMQYITFKDVLDLINGCPHDTKLMYENSLGSLKDGSSEDVEALLTFIYFSGRPLTISELAEGLGVHLKAKISEHYLITRIRSTCSGLVRIGSEGEVELFHYSLRECLAERYKSDEGHLIIARACLDYLLGDNFSVTRYHVLDLEPTEANRKAFTNSQPFFEYASSSLGYHLKNSRDLIEELLDPLSTFLRDDSANYRTWDSVIVWVNGYSIGNPTQAIPVLHFLAVCNIDNILDRVFLAGEFEGHGWRLRLMNVWIELQKRYRFQNRFCISGKLNAITADGGTMLHFACAYNSKEAVVFFLNHCSLVNTRDNKGKTPLHLAVANPEIVTLLVTAGADINATDNVGETCLMSAVESGEELSAEILLRAGALPNATTQSGFTALGIAMSNGLPGMVQLLIDYNADVNQPFDAILPIVWAIRSERDDIFEILLNHSNLKLKTADTFSTVLHEAVLVESLLYTNRLLKKDVKIDVTMEYGGLNWTALLMAIKYKYVEIAKSLLTAGASARLHLGNGSTALHLAAQAGLSEICEMILDQGCDVNAVDGNNDTALILAAQGSHDAIVVLLLMHGADPRIEDQLKLPSALHIACEKGNKDIVNSLLNSRLCPNINSTSGYGETPVGFASAYGFHEIVELLIEHGAKIEIANDALSTPLLRAVWNNHEEVVKVLLKYSADTMGKNPEWTPLHSCAFSGREKMLSWILESFPGPIVDFECKASDGQIFGTALYQAALGGHYGAANILVKAGARVDYPSSKYSTLLAACFGGSLKLVIYFLIHTGIGFDDPGYRGSTPLMCACLNGHTNLVDYFIRRGADRNAQNERKDRPIHIAMSSKSLNKVEVLKLLLANPHDLDIDALSSQDITALHIACGDNNLGAFKLLLGAGADPMIASGDGKLSILSEACFRGHTEIVLLLLKHPRVDLTFLNYENRNCLQIALAFHRLSIVSLIFSVLLGYKEEVLDILLLNEDTFGFKPFDYMLNKFSSGPLRKRSMRRLTIVRHIANLRNSHKATVFEFSILGKGLVYINDDENAVYAYQKAVLWSWDDDERTQVLGHYACCSNCNSVSLITNSRYICRVCRDTDLCYECHEKYQRRLCSKRVCEGHTFLCVPLPLLTEEENLQHIVKHDAEEIDAWLTHLEKKYSLATEPSYAEPEITDEFNGPESNKTNWTVLHMLGKLRFYTPLTKLSQPLPGSLWDSISFHAEAEGYVVVDALDLKGSDEDGEEESEIDE